MQDSKIDVVADVEHFMELDSPDAMADWILNSSMYSAENMIVYWVKTGRQSYMKITQDHKPPFYTLPTKECINKIISIIKVYNVDSKPVKITEVCAGVGLFGRILKKLNYEVDLTDETDTYGNVVLDVHCIKSDHFKSDRFNVCICVWPFPWTDTTQIIDNSNVDLLITIGEPVGWATGVNIPSPSAYTSVSVCESIACSMYPDFGFINCMYVTTKRNVVHKHDYVIGPELYDEIGENEKEFMAKIRPARMMLVAEYYNRLKIQNPVILKK